jgi:hypothetical protein
VKPETGPSRLSSPQKVGQRLIDRRIGSGVSPQKRIVDVDHRKCRAFPESHAGAKAACGEVRFVTLAEELVPDRSFTA